MDNPNYNKMNIRYSILLCSLMAAYLNLTAYGLRVNEEEERRALFESDEFLQLVQSEYERLVLADSKFVPLDRISNKKIGGAFCQSWVNNSYMFDFI